MKFVCVGHNKPILLGGGYCKSVIDVLRRVMNITYAGETIQQL